MSCSLCDLPTPDPPVTADDVAGEYCCRGCLAVTRSLGDGDPESVAADEARREADRASETAVPDDAEEAYLRVEGMHCSTCEAFLEARLARESGVYAVEASYPADLLRVSYDPDDVAPADLPAVVDGFGYTARLPEAESSGPTEDRTTARLLVGVIFGMMTMMWYLLLLYPTYLGLPDRYLFVDVAGGDGAYVLWNTWLAATVILGYTGGPILRGAYVSLRARLPNMDLLVALAATTAYVYSTLVLLTGGVEVYFDVTVAIVLVVTIGERYEKRVKARAAGRLTELTENRVEVASRVVADGSASVPATDASEFADPADLETESVAVDDLTEGDRVVVEPGDRLPVDGTVESGTLACDESLLTGESRPVAHGPGEEVVGGSLVLEGTATVTVAADAHSTLDRLVRYLWAVQSSRRGVQRLADKLAVVFVPLVVVLGLVTVGWQLYAGASPTAALLTGLTVLVVSCPCALGLATPLATAAGVRAALDGGVVVTDASLFERATEADVLVLDKTGTLTTGRMRLTAVHGDDRALGLAAAVERFADHPVAAAIADAGREIDASASNGEPVAADREVADFEQYAGRGASAHVDGTRVVVGRRDLLERDGFEVPADLAEADREAREAGQVSTLVGWEGAVRGLLVAGHEPRPGWEATVSALAEQVDRVVVLTGDTHAAAERFERHPAIDEVFAAVPPEAKTTIVERLREERVVAMVGDGSNDAPALAAADVGFAMAEGTRLAADAADAAIVDGDLASVDRALAVARSTRRRVRGNLAWAFTYNLVALPLAMAGLLNPLFAAVAMSASSLLVVANSARGFGVESDADAITAGSDPRDTASASDESGGATGTHSESRVGAGGGSRREEMSSTR